MAVNKVELYVSQILEDLDNGLTWLKRDDVGYGSIQEKYNAKDQQITMIRKHPKLKDAETNVIVFTVIDDTDDKTTTVPTSNTKVEEPMERVSSDVPSSEITRTENTDNEPVSIVNGEGVLESSAPTDEESADAFFNL